VRSSPAGHCLFSSVDTAVSGAAGELRTAFQSGEAEVSDHGSRSPVDVYAGRWWVVHTRARNEKVVTALLSSMRLGYFLPLARVGRRYGGRTRYVRIPLFPGYLFLCGGVEERYATLMTHRVANVIFVADQETLKTQLRHIYRATSCDAPVDLYPGIRRGQHCRVRSGALKGLEGVVLRRRSLCRVYIAVDVLGQSAEVEIDPSLLEIIE
jgi:transcription antitermination factor NusG